MPGAQLWQPIALYRRNKLAAVGAALGACDGLATWPRPLGVIPERLRHDERVSAQAHIGRFRHHLPVITPEEVRIGSVQQASSETG